jgi:site-specific DNA recombinase
MSTSRVACINGPRHILPRMTTSAQPRAAIYARQSRNKAKSIADQLAECREEAEGARFLVVAEYKDGESASRYARRVRADWALLLAAIDRREVDVIVLWESSRGDRTLTTWSRFLDLCRDRDVLIHVVNDGRTYDLNKDSDWRTLASAGVDSAHESAKISKRTARGVASAARDGRPPQGPCPYGYLRVFNQATGLLEGQEIDPGTSPVAREIIVRTGLGEPTSAITRDLNERGVTPPGGGPVWYRQRVREIALSPVYAGKRVHRPGRGKPKEGERAVYEASWPAIVTEAEHYAAVRTLMDPARLVSARPGRQVYLLTYLATCEVCSGPISANAAGRYYVCRAGHVAIGREVVDKRVTDLWLTYLVRDDVYAILAKAGEGADKEVMAARDEVAELRGRLDMWRASAAAGTTTPDSLASIEADLTRQIRAAGQRAERAALPPGLRHLLEPGVDVAKRWASTPLAAKRRVLAEFLTVQVRPSGRSRYVPIAERVIVTRRSQHDGVAGTATPEHDAMV